jgi:hypothetical protein
MSKIFEIEVPGLPEGWKPVEYRPVKEGEDYFCFGAIQQAKFDSSAPALIVEKIKPKRIVLECAGEVRRPEVGEYVQHGSSFTRCSETDFWGDGREIWREVKEETE